MKGKQNTNNGTENQNYIYIYIYIYILLYARLSLKTQSLLRSAIANLPTEIQFRILESMAMFRSFDL